MQQQKNKTKQNISLEVLYHVPSREDYHPSSRARKQRLSAPSIFIAKTFEILQNDQYSHIAKWNQDGTSFVIEDVDKFEEQILPIYFRHRNFSSFVRQLNMYDFHKIRNEANLSIFEHKEFRRHHKQALKNIRRKGCHAKKTNPDDDLPCRSEAEEPEFIKSRKTVDNSRAYFEPSETIIAKNEPMTSAFKINVLQAGNSPRSPLKRRLIDQFISSLPESVESEKEIEEVIRAMKKNPRYSCLDNKEDLRKIVKKLKRSLVLRPESQELEDLSIEEEIIVENIRGANLGVPSLAVFCTEKFIPMRSISLIGSMHFGEEVENLLYRC